MSKKNKISKPRVYRFLRYIVKKAYKEYEFSFPSDFVHEGGHIYVSNHAQAHGPLTYQLYYPYPKKIWAISELLSRKEAADFALQDFWPHKKKRVRWVYYLFSKLVISWLSPYLMKNSDTIAVYKDMRLRKTFRATVEAIRSGEDIIIFPEHDVLFNEYFNDFQRRFVDFASYFYKTNQRRLNFYPVFISPDLKKVLIGEPTLFDPSNNIENERERVIKYLQDKMTSMADSLPPFVSVPYKNI